MKRLMVLGAGCLILGLIGMPGVFGQKKGKDLEEVDRKEIPGLVKDLKSNDAAVRTRACTRLGLAGMVRARDIKDAVPTLLEMAKSESDTGVRLAATRTLGYANPDPEVAVPLLIGVLKEDKELSVKAAAAGALGYLGSDAKAALPALEEARSMAKGADKTEKDKIALGKAAGQAINAIMGKGKK
jgi:HEAT repeat protein